MESLQEQLEHCILNHGVDAAPLGDCLEERGLLREAAAMRAEDPRVRVAVAGRMLRSLRGEREELTAGAYLDSQTCFAFWSSLPKPLDGAQRWLATLEGLCTRIPASHQSQERWYAALSDGMESAHCGDWRVASVREFVELRPIPPWVPISPRALQLFVPTQPLRDVARRACPTCGAPGLIVVHSKVSWDAANDPTETLEAQVVCVAEPHLVTIAEDLLRSGVR